MASFRQLMENLGELTSIPSRVAKDAAEKIAHLIDDQFSQGCDPYGNAWADLAPATKAKGRLPPPLTDTGKMRGSVQVKPLQGAGIEISIAPDYAHFHQTGTVHMPERSILPDGTELPEEWDHAIETAMTQATKRAMGGK